MSKARKAKGEAGETGGDVVPVAEVIEKVVAAREYQFTKENAAEAQAASRVSLVKNNLEKKIVKLEATEEIRRRQDQIAKLGLTKMSTEVTREQLPEIGLAIIADHGLRVLGGEWEMKTAEEATKVAKSGTTSFASRWASRRPFRPARTLRAQISAKTASRS